MTTRSHTSAALALLAAGCVLGGTQALADPPQYTIVPFGPVGELEFTGHRINDNGTVLGLTVTTDGFKNFFSPVVWTDGLYYTMPKRFKNFEGFMTGINDQNIVVGYEEYSLPAGQALVTDGRSFMSLGTLGGGYSYAQGVNNTGTIVGYSTYGQIGSLSKAFAWKDGKMTQLPGLADGYDYALAVNDAGDVVGWSWDAGWQSRPVIWPAQGGGPIPLSNKNVRVFPEQASDINEAGQVVGHMGVEDLQASHTAFLWQDGELTDLGVLEEAGRPGPYGNELINTRAVALNDAGQIVGNSNPHFPDKDFETRPGPFFWEKGEMHNLNDLIDRSNGSKLVVSSTLDINNSGTILATAHDGVDLFDSVTVLLVPIKK